MPIYTYTVVESRGSERYGEIDGLYVHRGINYILGYNACGFEELNLRLAKILEYQTGKPHVWESPVAISNKPMDVELSWVVFDSEEDGEKEGGKEKEKKDAAKKTRVELLKFDVRLENYMVQVSCGDESGRAYTMDGAIDILINKLFPDPPNYITTHSYPMVVSINMYPKPERNRPSKFSLAVFGEIKDEDDSDDEIDSGARDLFGPHYDSDSDRDEVASGRISKKKKKNEKLSIDDPTPAYLYAMYEYVSEEEVARTHEVIQRMNNALPRVS